MVWMSHQRCVELPRNSLKVHNNNCTSPLYTLFGLESTNLVCHMAHKILLSVFTQYNDRYPPPIQFPSALIKIHLLPVALHHTRSK